MPLTPGTRLGSYEILAPIGAGGMGEVYRAHDTKLGRDVALKTLPSAFTSDVERVARFKREAQVLAALNHPHIAAIYGLDEAEGSHFLVLELAEGETLATRLERGPLPVGEALAVARQVADALEAAHEKGIVHRDLKPANIALSADGLVKVLDFGLAKAVDAASSPDLAISPTMTFAATQVGVILGTAPYMSPEQAKGRPADKRSDVWAFGCVLYEMLAGRRAFDGEDVTDTITAIIRDEPNWALLPSDVPEHVRLLLQKCLEKDRRARVSDIAVARFLLGEHIQSSAALIATVRRRWRLGPMAAVAALAIATAAGSLWLGARLKPEPTAAPARFVLAPPASLPLFLQGFDRDIVISPDGSTIVYRTTASSGGGTGGAMFAVRSINDVTPRLLGGAAGREPFMSPDGRWLGYSAGGELRKISMTGGTSITIGKVPGPLRGVNWGADDRIVFGVVDPTAGLQSIPAAGGEVRALTKPAVDKGEVGHYYPFTMPDGNAVLFTIGTGATTADNGIIAVLDQRTGRYKTLIRGGTAAVFVEPGFIVYSSRGTLHAVGFDRQRLEVTGEPIPLIDEVRNTTVGDANFSVSRNGTLVYVVGGALAQSVSPRSLVWVDRHGTETPVKAPSRPYGVARLSPDGTRVALDIRDPGDIWIWDLKREILTPLSLDQAIDLVPVWTHDSRKIIWSSSRGGGNPNLYMQSADGTGPVDRVTSHERAQFATSVTPDGSRVILFSPNTASGVGSLAAVDIFTAPISPAGPLGQLLQSSAQKLAAEVSPDGHWIAYQSDESNRREVFVRPYPNVEAGRWQISTDGGTRPAWSPKGDELFYLDGADLLTAVRVHSSGATFTPGKPVKVLNGRYVAGSTTRGYDLRSYDVSADGQRFLMLKETAGATAPAPQPTMTVVLNWIEEVKSRVPIK